MEIIGLTLDDYRLLDSMGDTKISEFAINKEWYLDENFNDSSFLCELFQVGNWDSEENVKVLGSNLDDTIYKYKNLTLRVSRKSLNNYTNENEYSRVVKIIENKQENTKDNKSSSPFDLKQLINLAKNKTFVLGEELYTCEHGNLSIDDDLLDTSCKWDGYDDFYHNTYIKYNDVIYTQTMHRYKSTDNDAYFDDDCVLQLNGREFIKFEKYNPTPENFKDEDSNDTFYTLYNKISLLEEQNKKLKDEKYHIERKYTDITNKQELYEKQCLEAQEREDNMQLRLGEVLSNLEEEKSKCEELEQKLEKSTEDKEELQKQIKDSRDSFYDDYYKYVDYFKTTVAKALRDKVNFEWMSYAQKEEFVSNMLGHLMHAVFDEYDHIKHDTDVHIREGEYVVTKSKHYRGGDNYDITKVTYVYED